MKVIKPLEKRKSFTKRNCYKNYQSKSQKGEFLKFLKPLFTAGLPLMKNLLTPLAKSVQIPLELSAKMSAAGAAIQKKIYGPGTTALIISNEEIEDIMKIVKHMKNQDYQSKELEIN